MADEDLAAAAPPEHWRFRLHEVIFEADTPLGKGFDVLLIISILASVTAVMLDSVESLHNQYGAILTFFEWTFTILFTVEYILRLLCVGKPIKYATSFFGMVDLLAVVPTYISFFIPGTEYLLVIRILRVLRVFRVLKLAQYLDEANLLVSAMRDSSRKISVFLFAMITMVIIFGSLMYIIEGRVNGFSSIPRSVYWAIVTMTTVGYGDISPQTPMGQTLAAAIMIMGYAIIAVPTGIVTAEMTKKLQRPITTVCCTECSHEGHDADASHCNMCGAKL